MLAVALLSTPNFAIHRTGHWARNWSNPDWPRPQHDAGPYDATGGIVNVLAVHHGTTGLFCTCGYEPNDQQRQ
jgi:hypothetical protein